MAKYVRYPATKCTGAFGAGFGNNQVNFFLGQLFVHGCIQDQCSFLLRPRHKMSGAGPKPIIAQTRPAFSAMGVFENDPNYLFAAEQSAQNRAALGVCIADGVAGSGVCGCFEHVSSFQAVFHFLSSR